MGKVIEIGPTTVVVQSDNFIESNVDDEAILMHLDEGNFSSVRSTGLSIWKIIEKPKAVSQICEILRGEFDVDEAQCREQTIEFLRDLGERGLITVD